MWDPTCSLLFEIFLIISVLKTQGVLLLIIVIFKHFPKVHILHLYFRVSEGTFPCYQWNRQCGVTAMQMCIEIPTKEINCTLFYPATVLLCSITILNNHIIVVLKCTFVAEQVRKPNRWNKPKSHSQKSWLRKYSVACV